MPNAQTRGGIGTLWYISLVYATPCPQNQNGTCHLQRMALLVALFTANYVNRYAHQTGQSLWPTWKVEIDHTRRLLLCTDPHVGGAAIRTSWASQGAARAVDWPCPAQYYILGCDFYARCLSCTNQQIKCPPFFSFLFSSIDMTDTTIRKYKSDDKFSEESK